MKIKRATVDDVDAVTSLYRDTIQTINIQHYTQQQVDVWSARAGNAEAWRYKVANDYFIVAVDENTITGFSSVTEGGHVDMLFVHYKYQGRGIAGALVREIENFATANNMNNLTTDASITAKPVFEHFGFTVVTAQTVVVDGVELTNYKMKKLLI